MNRFNLTFSGEILAGHDPATVKLRFGKLFAIDDPVRLERFFSGQLIILRRNLERKAAAQYYQELRQLGVAAALVKVTASESVDALLKTSPVPQEKSPVHPPQNKTVATAQAAARQAETLRRAAEQAAREQAAREEQQRKAQEDKAREQARAEEAKRRAEEEAARKASERALHRQREEEEAARKQAAKAESKRKAAAEAERKKILREGQKAERARQKAAAAAKRRAELELIRQREAEEAARMQAELAARKRREAEEAARVQAELAERKRREAEEAARQKAEREEIERQEAARLQAELAARKRREAEEAARVQAELAARKRREDEEAARQKAEQEEIERQEAAEAARLQEELAQIKQQEAQEAARIKADAQRREEEAQRQSEERRRVAAEQRAQRKEERRIAAARQAELKLQQAKAARQQAREVARRKADQRRLQKAEKREHAALKESLQEQVVQRAAAELAQASGPMLPGIRVGPIIEIPGRRVPDQPTAAPLAPRKRQSGEPNLYKLRPFRNTDEVRARSEHSRQRIRHGYTFGAIALATLLIAAGYLLRHPSAAAISGATAIAVDAQSAPLLLAGSSLLFHDRAGISTKVTSLSTLAVNALQAPLAFDSSGALLAPGRLVADSGNAAAGQGLQLLRCELEASSCKLFSAQLQNTSIDTFVIHPLDGSVLLANHRAGELLKISREGKILARASAALPKRPVLRLHGGLLFMNSAEGPGISVFRYEDTAFGQQLDEILLLPPQLQETENVRVDDFLWSSGTWWASLAGPSVGMHGLYRFDEKWNYLDQVTVPGARGTLQLVSWGEKTLVNDRHHAAVQRFSASGKAEAPFVSKALENLVAKDARDRKLTTVAWRAGLLLLALAAVMGLGFGYFQALRTLVYRPRREHGAEPVDNHADDLHWIDPVPQRSALLRRRSMSYALLVAGILLVAVAQSVSVWQLAALLLALSGPAIALLLLGRHPVGHIGTLQDRLLLVDHTGLYHLAGGSSVQHYGPFLAIDDVVVFTGNGLLPAFSPQQLQKLVGPLALGGVKVDRETIVVKLLQCRHPFAQGACVIVIAAVAAIIPLCLQGIF